MTDEEITKKIPLNRYTIAKKEFEIAYMYLSGTYSHVPEELHYDIRTVQKTLEQLALIMKDLMTSIKNSGQPEKK